MRFFVLGSFTCGTKFTVSRSAPDPLPATFRFTFCFTHYEIKLQTELHAILHSCPTFPLSPPCFVETVRWDPPSTSAGFTLFKPCSTFRWPIGAYLKSYCVYVAQTADFPFVCAAGVRCTFWCDGQRGRGNCGFQGCCHSVAPPCCKPFPSAFWTAPPKEKTS